MATWVSKWSVSAATGRKSKIPPPPLSISTIVSGTPMRVAVSSDPASCASVTSPVSSTTGPGLAAATPYAVAIVPSMPLAPRLERTRSGTARAGDDGLDVADGHRRRDHERRLGRQGGSELERDPRLAELLPEESRDRRGGAGIGVAPGAGPRGVRGRGLRGERLQQRGGIGVDRQVADVRGVLPGAVRVDEDLDASRPASHSRRGLEVGRSPTRSDARAAPPRWRTRGSRSRAS